MLMQNQAKSGGLLSDLVTNARLAWKLFRDPRVPSLTKYLIPGLAIAYVLLPIDFLPDFIPGLGQIDDLAIVALAIKLFIDMSPQSIVQFYRDQFGGKQKTSEGGAGSGSDRTVEGEYRVKD
jgi:uncharacterized membrane protein YkvA (DUF1232 family)